VADPGEDGDVGLVVVGEGHPAVGELAEVLEIGGVALLGAVDRDGDDVAVFRVVDGHARSSPGALVYTGARRGRQPAGGRGTPTGMLACPRMARIRVVFESGEPERVIEFDPRNAPFQHDGRPGSILDVLLPHGLALDQASGGTCASTTCPP